MFNIIVDPHAIAAALGKTTAELVPRLRKEVQLLSISAHAFVIKRAQDTWQHAHPNTLARFLGEDNENVRWSKLGKSQWLVEIDESVKDLEEGAPRQFMDWLLTNNPKAKRAKDGSMYASIPITSQKFAGPRQGFHPNQALASMVRNEMKRQGISLRGLERDPAGNPLLGVLHRIEPPMPGSQSQFPSLYSAPRTPEMARLIGLPEHEGIPYLEGTMIVQREVKKGKQKGKVVREAVTFRTISSKHKAEGRWFRKEIIGLQSLPAAEQYARTEWEKIVLRLRDEFAAR